MNPTTPPAGPRPTKVSIGAVHGDHVAVAGNYIYQAAAGAQVSWPVRVGRPPAVVDQFQSRDSVDLAGRFARASEAGVVTLVSAGLGGTGKTQLAAAYARSVQEHVDLLVWITAAGQSAIISGYAAAARAVGADNGGDEDTAAGGFLNWLEGTERQWLIVLDDLDDPADVDRWWPTGSTGEVLVTTRRRDQVLTGPGRIIVDIDVFSPDEADHYLSGKLASTQADDTVGLANDLGYLPLALTQAAAYMTDRNLTCSQYRRRLADRARTLDVVLPSDAAAPGYRPEDQAHNVVATTWSLSIAAANRLHPRGLAARLLDLLSVLDPNGVPTSVLTSASALSHLSTGSGPCSSDDVADAIAHLGRFSLTSTTTEWAATESAAGPVRLHALLQRTVYEQLPSDRRQKIVTAAADSLSQMWPAEDYRPANLELTAVFRANTSALNGRAGDLLWIVGRHAVLWQHGESLRALPHSAAAHWEKVVATACRLLGPIHPDALGSRDNLAVAYRAAGRLAEAIPLFESTLRDREELLGSTHPDALASRNNLAVAYQGAGRLVEAIELFESTFRYQEELLGLTHPYTIASRNNLALAHWAAGRPAEAIPLFESTLRDREELLGLSHPDTLTSRANLALAYQDTGQLAEAIPLLESVLHDFEKLLGLSHPDTLTSRGNAAGAYQAAGQLAEAISLFESTLRDREELLGLSHPDTLNSRHNLAGAYQAAERLAEAIPLFESTLRDREELLGLTHPDTVTTRNNLAGAYQDASRPRQSH